MQISVTKRRPTIFPGFEMLHHRQAVNNTFFIRFLVIGWQCVCNLLRQLAQSSPHTIAKREKDPTTYRAVTASLRVSD